MADFTPLLQVASLSPDGSVLTLTDISNYADAAYPRDSYGLFIEAILQGTSENTNVELLPFDPISESSFSAVIKSNGRYVFTMYLFLLKSIATPVEGIVCYDAVSGKLVKYTNAAWVEITFETAKVDALYSKIALITPVLGIAYAHKNLINLEYIKAVKKEISKGAEQNKLFYKRTDLDYFSALIDSAEYNWSLGNYYNFQEIVEELDKIIATREID